MLDYQLLAALAAVIRTGSFEEAARHLGITASAVSQRIKLLEERMGAVLVIRDQPCRGTEMGQRLCQHVEQVTLLEEGLKDFLPVDDGAPGWPTIRVSVNADSLATWFITAMANAGDLLFDLVIDDQDHSADWLRRGDVLAAVTSHAKPVRGCNARPLGAIRYMATASPAFVARWCPDGFNSDVAAHAPCLTFDRKDQLQQRWLKQALNTDAQPPVHWLPSPHAFVEGAVAGLGWGMNPLPMVEEHLEAGRLVALLPDQSLDVPLYWQQSRIAGQSLERLRRAVSAAAGDWLVEISENA